MVRALDVSVYLGAQKTVRERMFGIAGHTDRFAVLDRHEHRACVRAIVRTRASDDGGFTHRTKLLSGCNLRQRSSLDTHAWKPKLHAAKAEDRGPRTRATP